MNYKVGKEMQWDVIGGSYTGELAAWFKNIHPDLAVAVWASSAVINAIGDFKSLDHDIMNKTCMSQDSCTAIINAIT